MRLFLRFSLIVGKNWQSLLVGLVGLGNPAIQWLLEHVTQTEHIST